MATAIETEKELMDNEQGEVGMNEDGSPKITENEALKYDALWGKHFVPVDPTTGKVHASAKQCFWEIIGGPYPASRAGEDMNAPIMHFELQRFYRNKWYEVRADPTSSAQGGKRKNVPWSGLTSDGQFIPGSQQISYPDLLKKFKVE
jgi:hypothetical protein